VQRQAQALVLGLQQRRGLAQASALGSGRRPRVLAQESGLGLALPQGLGPQERWLPGASLPLLRAFCQAQGDRRT